MTTLTYIMHSGFVLETDKCTVVTDYWKDPYRVMDEVRKKDKPMYVLASHFHEDHFTREIFGWKNKNTRYILSKDILKHRRAQREEADAWMAKGDCWQDENISLKAMGSNDSGVSWIIQADGMTVLHAGDLCNWYARFLETGSPDECIYSEEFGISVNPVKEEKRFLGELKDIRKITGRFDIAMMAVDGRIGNGYTLGARQLTERFDVGLFVPMHFTMSGYESAWRMEPYCREKGIGFWKIGRMGETIVIDNNSVKRQEGNGMR